MSISRHGNLVGNKTPAEELLIDLLDAENQVMKFHQNHRKEWRPDFLDGEEVEHFQNYPGLTQRDDI